MESLTIGQLRVAFMDKFTIDEVTSNKGLQLLYFLITERYETLGVDFRYIPCGEVLSLLREHAPGLLDMYDIDVSEPKI